MKKNLKYTILVIIIISLFFVEYYSFIPIDVRLFSFEYSFYIHIILITVLVVLLYFWFSEKRHLFSLLGMDWDEKDFCRGWLITGRTGSGKTTGAISQIFHSLFQKCPTFGGVIIDAKANSYHYFEKLAQSYNQKSKVKTIKIRPSIWIIKIEANNDEVIHELVERLKFLGIKEEELDYAQLDTRTRILEIYSNQITGREIQEIIEGIEGDNNCKLELEEIVNQKFVIQNTFNLIGDNSIPAKTYAIMLADAINEKSFNADSFSSQTVIVIARMIDFLRGLNALEKIKIFPVDLEEEEEDKNKIKRIIEEMPKFPAISNIAYYLFNLEKFRLILSFFLNEEVKAIIYNKKLSIKESEILDNFYQAIEEIYSQTLSQEETTNQFRGIVATIENYISPFMANDVKEVFCTRTSTIKLSDVENGKLIAFSIPVKYEEVRKVVGSFLKGLFYNHSLNRLSQPTTLNKRNLLVGLLDEAQNTVSGGGFLSDDKFVDKAREARATLIVATQSVTSFDSSRLSKQEKDVLLLNLSNCLFFQGSDDASNQYIVDRVGSREKNKESRSYSRGRSSTSVSKEIKPFIRKDEVNNFAKFYAIAEHCSQGFRKGYIPPLNEKGKVPLYYWKLRLWELFKKRKTKM